MEFEVHFYCRKCDRQTDSLHILYAVLKIGFGCERCKGVLFVDSFYPEIGRMYYDANFKVWFSGT